MKITSCEMPGWMKHKLESRLLGKISITSDYVNNTTPMAQSKKELKGLLTKVKEESEKLVKKKKPQHSENKDHGIQSHHFMANRWGTNRNSERLYCWELQNHCTW